MFEQKVANCYVWIKGHVLLFLSFFREIGQKSSEELAREGSGVKAFASFLSELGTLVPELMIPNISVLITHLEGEVLHTCSSCWIEWLIYSSSIVLKEACCTIVLG